MATFEYIALNSRGEETVGAVEAATEHEAIEELRGSDLYPTKIADREIGRAHV